MSDVNRHGKKWTIPEVLKLHREYELLNLSVDEIAKNHRRSVASILYKLEVEGLISSLHEMNGYSLKKNKTSVKKTFKDLEDDTEADSSSDYNDDNESELSDDDSDYDEEDFDTKKKEYNMNNLSDRVWNLETNVEQISSMVKQMFNQMTGQKKTKCSKNKLTM
jgi:ABC-type Zn2+ transport system substrate-binding protein/surface adhesin